VNETEPAIEVRPIGVVRSPRSEAIDDDWGAVESVVTLDAARLGRAGDGAADADLPTAGLDAFSHVEVVFVFHRVDEAAVTLGTRHPRGRTDWPRVGILAQRAKSRPNRIGTTVCELLAVDGLDLTVRGLDAIDGTPVLDVKPYLAEFAPRSPTRQPAWATELMRGYWARP
jgi:tRNA-Thr(GGU) m(6)t(6)A37 methyltransferase TsaA